MVSDMGAGTGNRGTKQTTDEEGVLTTRHIPESPPDNPQPLVPV